MHSGHFLWFILRLISELHNASHRPAAAIAGRTDRFSSGKDCMTIITERSAENSHDCCRRSMLVFTAGCATTPPPPPPPTSAATGGSAGDTRIALCRRHRRLIGWTIPPRDASGVRQTINTGLSPDDAIWHFRSGWNVAALNCIRPVDEPILTGYGRMLELYDRELALLTLRSSAVFVKQQAAAGVMLSSCAKRTPHRFTTISHRRLRARNSATRRLA